MSFCPIGHERDRRETPSCMSDIPRIDRDEIRVMNVRSLCLTGWKEGATAGGKARRRLV